jgi:hypothetical protein
MISHDPCVPQQVIRYVLLILHEALQCVVCGYKRNNKNILIQNKLNLKVKIFFYYFSDQQLGYSTLRCVFKEALRDQV